MLTNEDKVSIINQHKKNVVYSRYNLEVSLIEEGAVANPNQSTVSSLNEQILDLDSKIAALDSEIESLS
jgi:hypothetical protein